MSILFFDGFDRCTITKSLDPNYWSYQPGQPLEYEKYAFGGYSYDHSLDYYPSMSYYNEGVGDGYYMHYSPNNGTLPTGIYRSILYSGASQWGYTSGNGYPGFGSPPGFVALSNIDISDNNNLAPITYLQLSGFNRPSGNSVFLTNRILGLETKDDNYADNDKPGRFGNKHPIVAFCSGNVTGLILSAVKVTGNHLETLEQRKMTMAIEVEQSQGVSGHFDMNITNDLNKYRIRSVFGTKSNNNSGNMPGRILIVDAEHQDYQLSDNEFEESLCPISRWCHLQFGIVGTGTVPFVQIKLEDVDLLQIPTDDTITDKDDWGDKIYISGFNFDNIRYFNRTYNGSLDWQDEQIIQPQYGSVSYRRNNLDNVYYGHGSMTLIDDVILSDDAGTTSTFLGKNAKVIPFVPGIDGYVNEDGVGITQWTSNVGSSRIALKNLDGDTGKISTSTSGHITAVPYMPFSKNYGSPDLQSVQNLGNIQDAIGGIKFYAQAKKEFLDTRYVAVAYTGAADPLQTGVYIMLNFDSHNPLTSTTKPYRTYQPPVGANEPWKFALTGNFSTDSKIGDQSIVLYSGDFLESVRLESAVHQVYEHPNLNLPMQWYSNSSWSNPTWKEDFTIECWIKFSGLNDSLTIFSKDYLNIPESQRQAGSSTTDTNVVRNHASFNISVNTGALTYFRYSDENTSDNSRSDYKNTGVLELYYPTPITDNDWHHIALSNTATGLIVFLDGVSGTSYGLDLSNINSGYDTHNGFDAQDTSSNTWVQNANSRTGTNELFYWGVTRTQAKNFTAGSNGSFDNSKHNPLRIYGNGYVDAFRVTKPTARYTQNFTPPLEMKGELDNYIQIGDIQTLTKTRYGRINQFYQYNNPIDNQPWTTGLLSDPSGFILGVKKV